VVAGGNKVEFDSFGVDDDRITVKDDAVVVDGEISLAKFSMMVASGSTGETDRKISPVDLDCTGWFSMVVWFLNARSKERNGAISKRISFPEALCRFNKSATRWYDMEVSKQTFFTPSINSSTFDDLQSCSQSFSTFST
jgi:hypothetical protein